MSATADSDPPRTGMRPAGGYPAVTEPETARHWTDRDPSEERWLREFIGRLWRNKGLLLTTIGLGTLATTIAVSQITPRYSASSKILVGVPKVRVAGVEEVLRDLRTDRSAIESEMEVLTSRTLAGKVADKLDLVNDPAFNPALRPATPSLRTLIASLDPRDLVPEDWRTTLFGAAAPSPAPTPEEIERNARRAAQASVQGATSVRIVGRSRVLLVTATAEDPKLAAAIANTLSDLYLLEQLEAKFEATRRATDWLNERVAELRQQVEASERAVEDYRAQHGLIRGKGTTVTEQQISEINTQLILARTQTAEAGARLRQIRALVKSEGGVDSAAEVLASPLIQRLREREADVARRTAEMATEYGPRHPKMINIQAELGGVRSRIETEVAKIVRGLRNELEVAQARERTLERNLDTLKTEATKIGTAEGRLRVLEREAAANRELFDTLLARWKEAGRREEIQHADARIISYAEVPGAPSSPNKTLAIGAALVVSAFLGVVLVLLLELLDHGFRSSEQIESMTGAGTLTLVPLLTALRLRRTSPPAYVLDRPASSFAESLRTLHTGLLLSNVDAPPKSVLVTSSLPSEGKTTIAVTLSRLVAASGRKVILIDADLRRSKIADVLGLPNEQGLVEVLAAEEGSLKDAIRIDRRSGLHVMTAGSGSVSSPPDLVGSSRMRRLISALGHTHDLIVIDSPPVHAVSDARMLAGAVDATMFVIQWEKTRREVAMLGLKQLMESGANVAGVALSMVNVRKNARYGYSDSGYYYGRKGGYRQYYTE